MSFKFKTVLLILSVSLLPYAMIMLYVGNLLQNEYKSNTLSEMNIQLDLSSERVNQYFKTFKQDMIFITKMDLMNDIYSNDLDKRISKFLLDKKNDFNLYGNLYVVKDGKILASSSMQSVGKEVGFKPFIEIAIYSKFDKSKIAKLYLEFSLKNITKFFKNTEDRNYYLKVDGKDFFKIDNFKNALHVEKELDGFKNIKIVLQEDKEVIDNILDTYKNWFILTLFLGALAISLISLFFVNRLIKPIIRLSKITDKITQEQNYSYKVNIDSNDEIGQLSKSFNYMTEGMSNALSELKLESENKLKLTEEKSKNEMLKQLSSKLSKYLSPQIYRSIFLGEQDVTLSSKRKKLTIFFSDIANFTDTTDSMESEDLSELLNDYLNNMTQIALKHGATVDKYIGDAIMLFFGDPESKGIKEDAFASVMMAIDMQEHMKILQREWAKKGLTKPFKVRMGINTGYCTVGNFGSENRLEYTIVGSPVNLASRIESSATPGDILISEETYLLVKDSFEVEEKQKIKPKGFTREIGLYAVKSHKQKEKKIVIEDDGVYISINENSANAATTLEKALKLIKN